MSQEKAPEAPTYEDKLQAQLAEQLQLPSLTDTTASTTKAPAPLEGKVRFHLIFA